MTILGKLLEQIFIEFTKLNIEYAIIGNYDNLPYYTSNDVDIFVNNHDAAVNILLSSASKLDIKLYLQNKTGNGTNNYFFYKVGNQIKLIKIDLMIETGWKSFFSIVPSEIIKNNIIKYKNFFVVNKYLEGCMHLLYPLLTFGYVKEKYKGKLYKLSKNDNFIILLNKIIGIKTGEKIVKNLRINNWSNIESKKNEIRNIIILKTLQNIDSERVKIFFDFIKSIFSRIYNKNGLVVSFTGLDGAGKTSIIEYLNENGHKYFTKGKLCNYYWRPFLLPRISKLLGINGKAQKFDESGRALLKNSFWERIKSYIKYTYYVFDFVIGKSKYFVTEHTGGLVIFDRYHLDNIVYPERFGFKVNRKIMNFLDSTIIPQPDIILYTTAPTKTLLNRKKELDKQEINNQKKKYNQEINDRKNVIYLNTNKDFKETINETIHICLEKMSERYK